MLRHRVGERAEELRGAHVDPVQVLEHEDDRTARARPEEDRVQQRERLLPELRGAQDDRARRHRHAHELLEEIAGA